MHLKGRGFQPPHCPTTQSRAFVLRDKSGLGHKATQFCPPQHPELTHRNRYQTPPARNQHAQIPCRAFFHPSPDTYLHKTEKGNTESSTTHFCFGIAKSSSWRKFAMSLWSCITAIHTWIFSTGRCYKGSQPYGQLHRIQINIFSSLIVNFFFLK